MIFLCCFQAKPGRKLNPVVTKSAAGTLPFQRILSPNKAVECLKATATRQQQQPQQSYKEIFQEIFHVLSKANEAPTSTPAPPPHFSHRRITEGK